MQIRKMTGPGQEERVEKQWLIGAAAAALIAGLAGGYGILENRGAAGADNEPEIVLCYGEVNPEGHVLTDSAQYFADRVSELTGGKVMVEIYPSGQAGGRCALLPVHGDGGA